MVLNGVLNLAPQERNYFFKGGKLFWGKTGRKNPGFEVLKFCYEISIFATKTLISKKLLQLDLV